MMSSNIKKSQISNMQQLKIMLENCYGIKKLETQLDFSRSHTVAIYASNGIMKTSFAKTFRCLSNDVLPKDELFDENISKYNITDEDNNDILHENIFVIESEIEINTNKKIQPLLINRKLQKQYINASQTIEKLKVNFINKLKELSEVGNDLEEKILKNFQKDDFFDMLENNRAEILKNDSSKFRNIKYNKIFNTDVIKFLNEPANQTKIQKYVKHYNILLTKSKYLQQGFDKYNAGTIQYNLVKHGFFDADHSINLNSEKGKTEIKCGDRFTEIIEEEHKNILGDPKLKEIWDELDTKLNKNVNMRTFRTHLSNNMWILPELENLEKREKFAKKIWISYFIDCEKLFTEILCVYKEVNEEIKKITDEAKQERGIWKKSIELFNQRFSVPFKIIIQNQSDVILKNIPAQIKFEFCDESKQVKVNENELLKVLSSGEKRALYILNIIFEIETRKKSKQETLFIIDDIAESFDYKNKYAIIQYLKDISEKSFFKLIILTHNFDFFRTICNRGVVDYKQCHFVYKTNNGIKLEAAKGINNIFTQDWLKNLDDPKKFIASIPFMRNIIEYTKNTDDENYEKLTSLLHCKKNIKDMLLCELVEIFRQTFPKIKKFLICSATKKVIDLIFTECENCLNSSEGINFENKIVLSIGIRLKTEQYIISKIEPTDSVPEFKNKQTARLIEWYKMKNGLNEPENIKIFEEVSLMTSENIHLNSFMYEPIIDMSDQHLKVLYRKLNNLCN